MMARIPTLDARLRRRLSRGLLVLALALAFPVVVLARGTFGDAWSTHYPSSASYTNASCDLCHGGDTSLWNAYGRAVAEAYSANGKDIDAAITSVEAGNADGDPGGKTNLEEINAGTQPGWTEGANNTIYDADGNPTSGQTAPAGIGSLDPAGADTTPPETTIATGPANVTKLTSATFTFTANETATFACSLDGAAYGACTSPKSYAGLAQGSHTFRVRATDAALNVDATPASRTWKIDTTAPVAKAPTSALRAGTTLGTSTVPVRLAWSATDAISGVAKYQLQQRTDASTTWASVTLPTPLTTVLTRSLAPGHAYQFRVRAIDKAGNTGAWATGTTFRLGLAQQGAATRTGTWTAVSSTAASGGSYVYASAAGASATYTFTGRTIAWVAPKTALSGSAKVYLDGVLATTVNLYSATTVNRAVVYTKAWTTVGTHTIKIVVVGTAGHPRVSLDAFVRLY